MRLDGRTALITGAARGIGLAIAERLARGGAALAIVADVTLTADVERALAIPRERWGRLDIVVNNAGITGRSHPIWELNDQDWHDVIACDKRTRRGTSPRPTRQGSEPRPALALEEIRSERAGRTGGG